MCGIVGVWVRDGGADRVRQEMSQAVAALRHRGPDDSGVWTNWSGVTLGHTRLSILDLSERGHQPMVSSDGRYVIVFNGEVYNFEDIKRRLQGVGHRFAGTGDTEVILAAYAQWGSAAFDELIGMFAIALWDDQRRTLELVRDRVGVKPLYFGWHRGTFCFASELKALKAFSHWRPEIDQESLGEFLQYGYIAGDRTIFKGIRKLRPGHRLTLVDAGEPEIAPYWSVLDAVESYPCASDTELEEEVEALLIESCRLRMVSDVPVGIYLSGGIDSSLVSAILAKHHSQDIRTFTIGFRDDEFDESRWAKKVAHHCGTTHSEYKLDVKEGLQIAQAWGSLFDEPFADASGIPTLLVSRLASAEVKVVLSADGGDELFSGYESYASVIERLAQLNRVPPWLGGLMSKATAALSPRLPRAGEYRIPVPRHVRGPALRKVQRLGLMLREPTAGRLKEIYSQCWQPEEIERLIGSYRSPRPTADDYPGRPATQLSLLDFHAYLPEDILTKVDRTTMAVSIEGREPLLDHRLAERALSLPPHLRRGALGPKHMLKKILYRYVPRELVERPKQGFAIPLNSWLKTDLKELLHDYLAEDRLRRVGIMDAHLVGQSIERFDQGDTTLGPPLWALLAFEMWREVSG